MEDDVEDDDSSAETVDAYGKRSRYETVVDYGKPGSADYDAEGLEVTYEGDYYRQLSRSFSGPEESDAEDEECLSASPLKNSPAGRLPKIADTEVLKDNNLPKVVPVGPLTLRQDNEQKVSGLTSRKTNELLQRIESLEHEIKHLKEENARLTEENERFRKREEQFRQIKDMLISTPV